MNRSVGKELKRLRVQANLKQKEVANQLGYTSSQFVSNWERGISCPPVKTIKQLAKIYKTSPEKLFLKIQKAVVDQMRYEFDKSKGA